MYVLGIAIPRTTVTGRTDGRVYRGARSKGFIIRTATLLSLPRNPPRVPIRIRNGLRARARSPKHRPLEND